MSLTPEPESYIHDSTPETEPNASDLNPMPETMGEPSPEWSKATEEWGGMWHFHQYGLGVIYALIFVLTLVSLLKQFRKKDNNGNNNNNNNKKKKVPKVVLNLLCVFGLSRCLFLCINAYNWRDTIPICVTKVLWGLGQPCMITAFTLVFIVMKNALILRQRFQNWYTTRNIAIATIPYFGFVLAAEMTVSFIPTFKGLTFICQLLYFLFAFTLTVFYTFISVIVWKKFRSIKSGNQWATQPVNCSKRTRSILRTCMAAASGGAVLCVMQTYAMFSVYGVFSNVPYVSAWPWLVFQTFFRVLEIYMAAVLYYAVTEKGVKTKRGDIAPTTVMFGGSVQKPEAGSPSTLNEDSMDHEKGNKTSAA